MNRTEAMGRASWIAFAVGAALFALSGFLMNTVPMSDVLLCVRAEGRCVVKHRTMIRSRQGAVPLATISGAELRKSRRRGADRLELWLTAGSQSFWISDFAGWQHQEADARLASLQRFLADPATPSVEIRRDFLGGPIGALVSMLVGCIGIFAGWRLRLRVPGVPA